MKAVIAATATLGHVPTASDYEMLARRSGGSLPSLATVRNRCETWTDALCAAGV